MASNKISSTSADILKEFRQQASRDKIMKEKFEDIFFTFFNWKLL